MHQQVDGRVPDTRSRRPEVPADLAALVRAMLAKSPDDRPTSATEAFTALARYARDLQPLPGVVDLSEPAPARMQALVVARILVDAVPTGHAVERFTPYDHPDTADRRAQLRRLRERADSLVAHSRGSSAIELLDDAVPCAARFLGDTHSDVVDLRVMVADLYFDGVDYRRAKEAYAVLLDTATGVVPVDEVRRWRRQEVTCLALAGDTATALTRLTALLADEWPDHGAVDDRVLDLPKQLGLLQLGMGEAGAATATFAALRLDMERCRGAEDPQTHAARELEIVAMRSDQAPVRHPSPPAGERTARDRHR
ncbi:hypothetical protein [Pseudonocardia alni]|uniref:hypothetical protein n=1 Tax=Pseudonocardia alni TaxID=33907 RepID=UPI0027DD7F3D|nr:hypothetical protein [Pseudonocardia alni]MBO4238586.1 hypothetical protein [Pseudonocardia alni]